MAEGISTRVDLKKLAKETLILSCYDIAERYLLEDFLSSHVGSSISRPSPSSFWGKSVVIVAEKNWDKIVTGKPLREILTSKEIDESINEFIQERSLRLKSYIKSHEERIERTASKSHSRFPFLPPPDTSFFRDFPHGQVSVSKPEIIPCEPSNCPYGYAERNVYLRQNGNTLEGKCMYRAEKLFFKGDNIYDCLSNCTYSDGDWHPI